jgi:hypothetical protein
MSQDAITWVLIGVIIALLIWNVYRRRGRRGNINLDAAMAVLGNVNDNLKIMDEHLANWQSTRKFKTNSWVIYKNKMGFLGTDLVNDIDESFTIAQDFNSRIDEARKSKVMSTLQDMQVEKIREPLTKGKEGLVAWLKTSYEQEQKDNPRRGCMGY